MEMNPTDLIAECEHWQRRALRAEALVRIKDAALAKLKPEKDCSWCSVDGGVCHSCMEMARIEGQVRGALNAK